jgi:hypothetical protein
MAFKLWTKATGMNSLALHRKPVEQSTDKGQHRREMGQVDRSG